MLKGCDNFFMNYLDKPPIEYCLRFFLETKTAGRTTDWKEIFKEWFEKMK